MCAPVDRSPAEPFVVIYRHAHHIHTILLFTICAGFLRISYAIEQRTKQNSSNTKCISFGFGFQHRTHTSFIWSKNTLYSSAAFVFVLFSLLHMRFDRILVFFFIRVFCSQIPLFGRIQWDSNLLFSFSLRKSDKIGVLLLWTYTNFIFYSKRLLLFSPCMFWRQQKKIIIIIENAAVSRQLRNT